MNKIWYNTIWEASCTVKAFTDTLGIPSVIMQSIWGTKNICPSDTIFTILSNEEGLVAGESILGDGEGEEKRERDETYALVNKTLPGIEFIVM